MADFVATHRITHEACIKMIDAGIAKANALGMPVSIAVVDAGGGLIAFMRMDGARFFSGRATIKKALGDDVSIRHVLERIDADAEFNLGHRVR